MISSALQLNSMLFSHVVGTKRMSSASSLISVKGLYVDRERKNKTCNAYAFKKVVISIESSGIRVAFSVPPGAGPHLSP